MTISASLTPIAAGAIPKRAITAHIEAVNLHNTAKILNMAETVGLRNRPYPPLRAQSTTQPQPGPS